MRKFFLFQLFFIFLSIAFSNAQSVIKIPFIQPGVFQVSPLKDTVELNGNPSVRLGETITIQGGTGHYTYSWTKNDTILSVDSVFECNAIGNYLLKINDGGGCGTTVQLTVQLGTKLNTNLMDKFRIFPNPAKDLISVELTDNLNLNSISICSAEGKLTENINVAEFLNSRQIRLKNLLPGQYILLIHSSEGLITGKFVKE